MWGTGKRVKSAGDAQVSVWTLGWMVESLLAARLAKTHLDALGCRLGPCGELQSYSNEGGN